PEPGSNSPNKNCPENHWQNKPHPQTGKTGCGKNKNNKQKPPNTLLSSQTTHPPSRALIRGVSPLTRIADGSAPTEVGPYLWRAVALCGSHRVATTMDKLREWKLRVKSPDRRCVSAAHVHRCHSSNAADAGDIPLAPAQHQPPAVQIVRRLGNPVLGLEAPAAPIGATLRDGAAGRPPGAPRARGRAPGT